MCQVNLLLLLKGISEKFTLGLLICNLITLTYCFKNILQNIDEFCNDTYSVQLTFLICFVHIYVSTDF